jgi:hypothetical protein
MTAIEFLTRRVLLIPSPALLRQQSSKIYKSNIFEVLFMWNVISEGREVQMPNSKVFKEIFELEGSLG